MIRHRTRYVTVHEGDVLDVLPRLRTTFDAVITDPPYMIGMSSVGNPKAKSGTWSDLMNSAWWYSEWASLCWDRIKETGYLAVFCNWRTLPTMLRAFSLANIPTTSCAVWDKEWIGPAYRNALRPRYEMIVLAARSEAQIFDRCQADVFRLKWMAGHSSGRHHAAEKPVELCAELVRLLTPEGGHILDPFGGSGTVAVAARGLGRRATVIETELVHVRKTIERTKTA